MPLATVILTRIPQHQLLKGSVWVRGTSSGMRLLGLPASQGVQEALLGSRKGHRAAFHTGTQGEAQMWVWPVPGQVPAALAMRF